MSNASYNELKEELTSLKLRYAELQEQTGKTGAELLRANEEIVGLQNEILKQCRIVGMGGSREAALMAQLEREKKKAEPLIEAINRLNEHWKIVFPPNTIVSFFSASTQLMGKVQEELQKYQSKDAEP